MIEIKSEEEIEIMAQGGKILATVLERVLAKAAPGITTLELDKDAESLILAAEGVPSFKGEKHYGFATCMNINDMVVHGVPMEYKLREGDILGVDLGVQYKGLHTDGSWTIEVRSENFAKREISAGGTKLKVKSPNQNSKFLETGKKALERAIQECRVEKRIGHISKAIQDTIEGAGYSCVKQLVGHGVGRILHEDPEIPCFLRGKIENTPEIKPGMVLAVEVIYNMGKSAIVYQNNDGWTIVTRDGRPSGLFEHTIAVTETGPRVLTKG